MTGAEGTGRRKELDKDISSYISVLRKKERGGVRGIVKSLRGKKKKKSVELHPEVESYDGKGKAHKEQPKEEEKEDMEGEFEERQSQKSVWQWLKEQFSSGNGHEEFHEVPEAEEPSEAPKTELSAEDYEMEEEYSEEVHREGWFSRLMGRIFVKSREEEELEEASDEIAEDFQDMKAIAEIATNVMKMLPKEKMHELKASEDFHNFKEILKKRNLIK